MQVARKISLLPFNTFHIDAEAEYFVRVHDVQELQSLLQQEIARQHPIFILGGGSNILLTKPVEGLVIQNQMKGIQIVSETEKDVVVKFMGGEQWHDCVQWCVQRNLGGIENLSLIPGSIGAAPIQNIGAYGVELQDVFESLQAIDLQTHAIQEFGKTACNFGYRQSVFKQDLKGRFMIVSVTLRLNKQPVFRVDYGQIKQELQEMGVDNLSVEAISEAVIRIRKSKLPDPAVIGNAGSFFKNPVIGFEQFDALKQQYPDLPSYTAEDGVKVPAAWLIEHAKPDGFSSWKGYREKNYGVHERQALCLVNYSDASGKDIFDLSTRILTSVQHTFNISLEREVNIW